MAKSDVLKTYSIVINASTEAASAEVDKLSKELDKKIAEKDLDTGLKQSFDKVKKSLDGLKGSIKSANREINKNVASINTQLSNLDVSKVATQIADMEKSISGSLKNVTTEIDGLKTFFENPNLGKNFSSGIGSAFKELTDTVNNSVLELKNASTTLTGILDGSIDLSKLVSTKNLKTDITDLEKYVGELQGFIDSLNSIKGQDFVLDKSNLKKLGADYLKELDSILLKIQKEYKLLGGTPAAESVFSQLETPVSSDYIKSFRKSVLNQLNAIEKGVGTTTKINLTYDIGASDESAIDGIVSKIKKEVITKVQDKLNNTPIQIPIGYTYDRNILKGDKLAEDKALNDGTTKTLLKHINLDVKANTDGIVKQIDSEIININDRLKTNGRKIEVEVIGKVNPNTINQSSNIIAEKIEDAQYRSVNGINIKGGQIQIDPSNGIATESTLSSIRDIISGWNKGGIPGTQTKEFKQKLQTEKQNQSYYSGLDTRLRMKKQSSVLTKREQDLKNTEDYLLASIKLRRETISEINKLARNKKLAAGDRTVFTNSDFYNKSFTFNGEQYAQYGNGEKLSDWKAKWDKILESTFGTYDENIGKLYDITEQINGKNKTVKKGLLRQTREQLNKQNTSSRESLATLGIEFQKTGSGSYNYENILAERQTITGVEDAYVKVQNVINNIKTAASQEHQILTEQIQALENQKVIMEEIHSLEQKSKTTTLLPEEQLKLELLKNQLNEEVKIVTNTTELNNLLKEQASLKDKIRKKEPLSSKEHDRYLQINNEINALFTNVDNLSDFVVKQIQKDAETGMSAIDQQIKHLKKSRKDLETGVYKEIGMIYQPVNDINGTKELPDRYRYFTETKDLRLNVPIKSDKEYQWSLKELERLRTENAYLGKLITTKYNAKGDSYLDTSAMTDYEKARYFDNKRYIEVLRTRNMIYEEQKGLISDLTNGYNGLNKSYKAEALMLEGNSEAQLKQILKHRASFSGNKINDKAYFASLTDNELNSVFKVVDEISKKTEKALSDDKIKALVHSRIKEDIDFYKAQLKEQEDLLARMESGKIKASTSDQRKVAKKISGLNNTISALENPVQQENKQLTEQRKILQDINKEKEDFINRLKSSINLNEQEIQDGIKLLALRKQQKEAEKELSNSNISAYNYYKNQQKNSKKETETVYSTDGKNDSMYSFGSYTEKFDDNVLAKVKRLNSINHELDEHESTLKVLNPQLLEIMNNNIDLTVAELRHWDEIESKRNQTIDKIFKIKAKQSGLSGKQYRSLVLGGKEFDPFDTTGEDYSSIYEKRVQALTALIKQENSVSNIGTAKNFLQIVQEELAYREKIRKEYEKQQAEAKASYDIEKKRIAQELKILNYSEKTHKSNIKKEFDESNNKQLQYINGKKEELQLLEEEQKLLKDNLVITEQNYNSQISKEQRKRGTGFKSVVINETDLLSQDKQFKSALNNKRNINAEIEGYKAQLAEITKQENAIKHKQEYFETTKRNILQLISETQARLDKGTFSSTSSSSGRLKSASERKEEIEKYQIELAMLEKERAEFNATLQEKQNKLEKERLDIEQKIISVKEREKQINNEFLKQQDKTKQQLLEKYYQKSVDSEKAYLSGISSNLSEKQLNSLRNEFIKNTKSYLALGGDSNTAFSETYKQALNIYEAQANVANLFNEQKAKNISNLQAELEAEKQITQEKINQNEKQQQLIKSEIQQAQEKYNAESKEENLTKLQKKQLLIRKQILDFEEGMSAKQKNASFAVDSKLLEIQALQEQRNLVPKASNDYEVLTKKITEAKIHLGWFREEAELLGLTLSETTGRMYLNPDNKNIKIKDLNYTGLMKSGGKDNIYDFSESIQMQKAFEKARLAEYYYHSQVVEDYKEQTKLNKRLTDMSRIAGMNDREAELALEVQKVNAQLQNKENLTKKQTKALEEQLQKLYAVIDAENKLGKINLTIGKNGYVDAKVSRSEFVENQEQYASSNRYIQAMLNNSDLTLSQVRDAQPTIENYRLATENTLQNIQKILMQGVKVKPVAKNYKLDYGKYYGGLNPKLSLDANAANPIAGSWFKEKTDNKSKKKSNFVYDPTKARNYEQMNEDQKLILERFAELKNLIIKNGYTKELGGKLAGVINEAKVAGLSVGRKRNLYLADQKPTEDKSSVNAEEIKQNLQATAQNANDLTQKVETLEQKTVQETEQVLDQAIKTLKQNVLVNENGVTSVNKKLFGDKGILDQAQKLFLDSAFSNKTEDEIRNSLVDLYNNAEATTKNNETLKNIIQKLANAYGQKKGRPEQGAFANLQNGFISKIITSKWNKSINLSDLRKSLTESVDTAIHSHPEKLAALSPQDVKSAFSNIKNGIVNALVVSFEETALFDASKINASDYDKITQAFLSKLTADTNKMSEMSFSKFTDGLKAINKKTNVSNALTESVMTGLKQANEVFGVDLSDEQLGNIQKSFLASVTTSLSTLKSEDIVDPGKITDLIKNNLLTELFKHIDIKDTDVKKTFSDHIQTRFYNNIKNLFSEVNKSYDANFGDKLQLLVRNTLNSVLSNLGYNIDDVYKIYDNKDIISGKTYIGSSSKNQTYETAKPEKTQVDNSVQKAADDIKEVNNAENKSAKVVENTENKKQKKFKKTREEIDYTTASVNELIDAYNKSDAILKRSNLKKETRDFYISQKSNSQNALGELGYTLIDGKWNNNKYDPTNIDFTKLLNLEDVKNMISVAETSISQGTSQAEAWKAVLPELKNRLEEIILKQNEAKQSAIDYANSFGEPFEFATEQLRQLGINIGTLKGANKINDETYSFVGEYGEGQITLGKDGQWMVDPSVTKEINNKAKVVENLKSSIRKLSGVKFENLAKANPNLFLNSSQIEDAKLKLQELYKFLETGYTKDTDIEKLKRNLLEVKNIANSLKGGLKLNESEIVGKIDTNNISQVRTELIKMARSVSDGSIEIGKFNARKKELVYTTRTADNVLQTYTISMNQYTGEVTNALVAEQKYATGFQKLLSGLGRKFNELIRYSMASFSLYRIFGYIKSGINIVKEMDKAMTELRKVSNDTAEELEAFRKESFKIANTIGSTGKEIVNSAAGWEKLGYSIKEASELAKNSALYANVGDMEINVATEHMVSALKAFNVEAVNSIDLVDKMNYVGNRYAITSAGIGEALERSASSLVAAGNNIDESIALITAGNTVSQDPESVGNAIKVLSLRIRGSKTELEEMDEETDNLASSTSKLREEIKALTGVDIMLNNEEYKSTYQILLEISKVWENLTDVSQANVLEKLAGKTRASVVAGLLQNGETLEKVFNDSMNSKGSAVEENERYMESIQGHLDILTNKWQELWDTGIDKDLIEFFIDFASKVLDVANNLGLLKTALITITGVSGFKAGLKNDGMIRYYNSEITSLTNNLGFNKRSFAEWGKQVSASFTQAGGGLKGFVNGFTTAFVAPKSPIKLIDSTKFSSLFGLNSDEFFKAFNAASFKSTEQVYKWCDAIKVTDVTMRSYLDNCMLNKVPATFDGYNTYVQSAIVKTDQLTASAKLAQIGFKGLSMIGSILAPMLIMTAITKIIQGLKWLTQAEERAIEKSKELREEFAQMSDEYKSNRQTIKDLTNEYNELSKGVDENGKNINLSAEEYDRYNDIISQILEINPQLITGWDAQGNAISTNNDLIKESINLLDEEYKRKLRNATTTKSNKEVFKGVIEEVEDFKSNPDTKTNFNSSYAIKKDFYDKLTEAEAQKGSGFSFDYKMADEIYKYLYPNSGKTFLQSITGLHEGHNESFGYFWDLLNIVEDNGDFDTLFLNSYLDENNPIYKYLDSDTINTMIENVNEYKRSLTGVNDELDLLYQGYRDQINLNIQAIEGYSSLPSNVKTFISEYVNDLDYSTIKTEEDAQKFVDEAKKFVNTLIDNPDFRIKVNELYELDSDKLTTEEYINAYNYLLEKIQTYANEHGVELPTILTENIDNLENQYSNIIDKATEKFTGVAYSELEEVEEKYGKAVDKRQAKYSGENKVGNVDLYNRPVVVNDDGTYSTVFTEFEKFANGDGTYSMVYYTPYLPNGELLDRSTLEAYINQLLNSDDPLGFDAGENGYKILYKVETTTKDGKPITDSNLETAYNEGNAWAENIHKEQHSIYGEEAQYKIQLEQANRVKKRIEDFTKQQGITTEVERDFWYECLESESTLQQAMRKYLNSNVGGISYNDYASNIQNLSKGLDPLGEIYLDMTDDDTKFDYSAFLNNEDFKANFDDFEDEYNEFIKVISSSNGKLTSEGQQAFNKLAGAYVKNKANLEGVTQATKATTIEQLKQMGVTNAEALVTEALTQKERNLAVEKEKLRLETEGVKISSQEEYEALIKEAEGNEIAKIAITQLWLQKMAVNGVKIDTSADIESIYNLATTALAGTQALAELARAKQVLGAVERANGDLEAAGVANWEYYDALNTLEKLKNGTYEFNFNQINLKNTTVDFAKAQDDAGDATDKLTEALEKEKEALEKTREKMETLHDAIIWFYDEQIEKIDDKIDKINEENEELEKQRENMDKVLAAIESNYDAEIKLIQDKIDALQDENDEEERALALEEAKRKLQEAKSRKILQVYEKGKGFVYTVDSKAIKEAEEELEELQENEVIAELEKQIEKLEEAKEKWSEIPEAYEKAMQEIAASKYFGSDWKNLTLFPSDELLNSFQGNYTGIQGNIESNENEIDSLEKEKEKIDELKKLWEDAKNAYQYSQYESKLSAYFGSDYEYQLLSNSSSWRKQYANEYSDVCSKIEELEIRIAELSDETSSKIVSDSISSQEALSNTVSKLSDTGKQISDCEKKAHSFDSAVQGIKDKTVTVTIKEVYESKSSGWYTGGWSSAVGGRAKGGIISKDDKGDLDFVAKEIGEDHMVALTEGEAVIPKSVVDANPGLVSRLINSNGKELDLSDSVSMQQRKMNYILNGLPLNFNTTYTKPSFLKNVKDIPIQDNSKSVELKIGDIHLHGVQDVDGFARALKQKLPMVMQRELGR